MNRTAQDSKIRRAQGTSLGMSNFLSAGLSLIFIAISGLLVINSVKTVSTAYQRSLLLDQAESEVRDLRLRNLELLEHLDYVSSKSFVEMEARNRLLYTKGDEVLIVLPQTAGEAPREEEDGDEVEEVVPEATGVDRWLMVLTEGV